MGKQQEKHCAYISTVDFLSWDRNSFFFSYFFVFFRIFSFIMKSESACVGKKDPSSTTVDHLAKMKKTIVCLALALYLTNWTEAVPLEKETFDSDECKTHGLPYQAEDGKWICILNRFMCNGIWEYGRRLWPGRQIDEEICPNGGKCVQGEYDYLFGDYDEATCECAKGFEGERCEVLGSNLKANDSEATENDLENTGSDLEATGTDSKATGTDSKATGTALDATAEKCKTHGMPYQAGDGKWICILNRFMCNGHLEYRREGHRIDEKICPNGGKCVEGEYDYESGSNTLTCECAKGFEGARCEQPKAS